MKPLLTRYQRLCLIEYLNALKNGKHQQGLYDMLMFDLQAMQRLYQQFKLKGEAFTDVDLPYLQQQTNQKVEEFVRTHSLFNDRDYLTVALELTDRGKIVIKPGQMLLMFSRGESEHDFFEFHKYPDEVLAEAAKPYYVPDTEQPVTRQEADRNLDYLTERWQELYQMIAFDELDNAIKKHYEKLRFEFHSPEVLNHLRRAVEQALDEWVEKHRAVIPHQHNFAVRVVFEDDLIVWYNSDFELLREGRHPLNFVHIDRNQWPDSMLRSAAHEERVKEARKNVQRP